MIEFYWRKFSELSPDELYALLKLRAEVFVVEQNCVYLDPDGNDSLAYHLLGMEEGEVVAYLRLFPPTENQEDLVFGRVVTKQSVRAKGYGKQLMRALFDYCEKHFSHLSVRCSAQHYLVKFYESFGLKAYGEIYLEDNIPHIGMKKD